VASVFYSQLGGRTGKSKQFAGTVTAGMKHAPGIHFKVQPLVRNGGIGRKRESEREFK